MEAAILQGLRTAVPKNKWRVEDYTGSFSWLWDIQPREGGEKPESTDGADCPLSLDKWLADGAGDKNLLIVWDGMPSLDMPSINITDHLTPVDWALSLSHRLLSDSGKALPALRIFILDCYSRQLPNSYGCRMLDSLLAALPWVWGMRLLPRGEQNRSFADQSGAELLREAVAADSSRFPSLRDGDRRKSQQIVDALVQAWSGSLAGSATYHDVNNLLGPLVLLEALNRKPFYELGRRALLQHARWLGFAPITEIDKDGNGAWYDAQSLADELNRTIRFVLVDDQANSGWKDVIAAALGIAGDASITEASADKFKRLAKNGRVELWAATGADPVVAKLQKALAAGGRRDSRFQLQFTEPEGSDAEPMLEVLLLDLRLAADRNAELQCFRAVVDLIDDLSKRNSDGSWPWRSLSEVPRFSSEPGDADNPSFGLGPRALVNEFARDTNIAATRHKNTYLYLLTLLPRVVATLDFALPVIVFSSTGQRSVTKEFRGYGNLITAFEKPRFASYRSDDTLLEAKTGYTTAIERTADILRARSAAHNICAAGAVTSPSAFVDGENRTIIELYLDETGNEFAGKPVTVGGVLVIGQAGSVQRFKTAVENEIRSVLKTATGDFKDHLTTHAEQLARCIKDNSAANGVHTSLVSLSGSMSDSDSQLGAVESAFKADNLYREIVGALIEAAIYHVGAEICGNSAKADYHVYMATRVQPIADDKGRTDLWDKWGIESPFIGRGAGVWNAVDGLTSVVKADGDDYLRAVLDVLRTYGTSKELDYPKQRRLRFVDFAAARPIVQGISRQYRHAKFKPRAEHARAYLLNRRNALTSPLHLMADTLMSRGISGDTISELYDSGFAGEYSTDFRTLLHAVRQAANDFVGDGFATAARCSYGSMALDQNDVKRRLSARLAKFIQELSGVEFMRMVNGIRSDREKARERLGVDGDRNREGVITRVSNGVCCVKLLPDENQVDCSQSHLLGGSDVKLSRGDTVSVEVGRAKLTSEDKIAFEKLVRYSRHPKWKELEKLGRGTKVVGRVFEVSFGKGVFVRLDDIDGFVPFDRAPSWRNNRHRPRNGTTLEFAVDSVDPERASLILVPVEGID